MKLKYTQSHVCLSLYALFVCEKACFSDDNRLSSIIACYQVTLKRFKNALRNTNTIKCPKLLFMSGIVSHVGYSFDSTSRFIRHILLFMPHNLIKEKTSRFNRVDIRKSIKKPWFTLYGL